MMRGSERVNPEHGREIKQPLKWSHNYIIKWFHYNKHNKYYNIPTLQTIIYAEANMMYSSRYLHLYIERSIVVHLASTYAYIKLFDP